MIAFEQVSFSYPGQKFGSLRDLNLTIGNGECVLLCGRSGCGKTTVTRLINGLIPYFFAGELRGRVTVDDMDIAQTPMYKIAEGVGSVFQNPRTQFFNMDTDGEIAFGIENEALPFQELHRRVGQTAKDLHIQNLRGRNIFALSGGEKQKIAFASVYAMNPDIYLLDEPSSNLDMASIEDLKEHLRLIKSQGKTILIAEHRLYYLMELADRVLYLEEGRITGEYTPRELAAMPGDRRAAMGLRCVDLHGARVHSRASVSPQPALELRDVSLRYKKQDILKNISLKASRGEVIAVMGCNGTGKTTFSRALCGLHKDCDGHFLWDERPMNHKSRLKQSYLVMQDVNYQLFAESVEKECIFGLKDPDEALAAVTLQELGLASLKNQHPNTLSGGQKQRLAAAVSMVCRKDLLVFDEPTSGLDYDSMVQVARLLKRLAQQQKIIFVVTHDYELIAMACTRIIHFDSGSMQDDLQLSPETENKLWAILQKEGCPERGETNAKAKV